jgi:hypothetical protein
MNAMCRFFFKEAIDFLRVRAGGTYVDCTLGLAGHAEGIARLLGPEGHLSDSTGTRGAGVSQGKAGRVSSELGQPGAADNSGERGIQQIASM